MEQQRTSDERTWGMMCHLGALAAFIGIPLGNVVGPLIVWLIKREQYAFVDDQGKESMNFQITLTIAAVALFIVMIPLFVLTAFTGIPIFLLAPLLFLGLFVGALIWVVQAAMQANQGVEYRYPFSFRFFK